ncbi:MAG: BTAD domain-containing putative transcriptional regulator, partial [Thiohalomonadales bacterium]
IEVRNINRLPGSISRYLNYSLGQNGYNETILSSSESSAPAISIEPDHEVSIHTLGHFNIQSQDQNLSAVCKGQHKPIEMLKALIALGGKDVGEMRLCEALWPDTDGDIAHSAFSVTLHRLRKLTGHKAMELNDSRLTLNPDYCWVDAWVCEHLLNLCNRSLSSRHVDKKLAMSCIESAMHLYHGPFLGNEDEQPWYIMYRQRLHSKMLRSLLTMCANLEASNYSDHALDLYQKGIELEPLAEEFYYRLMRRLAKLDRKAEAILVFLRCQKIFQTSIGVNPSRVTESLYKTLLN